MYFWAISSRARKEENTTDPRTTAESSSNPSKRSLVKCLSFIREICIKVLITNIGVVCNWRSEAFKIHPQKIVMFSAMAGLSSMMSDLMFNIHQLVRVEDGLAAFDSCYVYIAHIKNSLLRVEFLLDMLKGVSLKSAAFLSSMEP